MGYTVGTDLMAAIRHIFYNVTIFSYIGFQHEERRFCIILIKDQYFRRERHWTIIKVK